MTDFNYKVLNLSELVQLCRDNAFRSAHRGLGRDTLIGLLEGEVDYKTCSPDPVDAERELMCYFQEKQPDIVFQQLTCSDQNYYCPDCPAGRVISCAVINIDSGLRRGGLKEIGRDPDKR